MDKNAREWRRKAVPKRYAVEHSLLLENGRALPISPELVSRCLLAAGYSQPELQPWPSLKVVHQILRLAAYVGAALSGTRREPQRIRGGSHEGR